MTIQNQDWIVYRGNWYFLDSEPLRSCDQFPHFVECGSENQKGYTASWAVVANSLFIVSLSGFAKKTIDGGFEVASSGSQKLFETDWFSSDAENVIEVGLEEVFPGCNAPVLADWYSGELYLQSGQSINNSALGAVYERQDFLTIDHGLVKGTRTVNRHWSPEQMLDPFLLRPVEELELTVNLTSRLKAANIHYIGDLVSLRGTKLMRVANLDLEAIQEVEETMASRGYILGTFVAGWPPESIRGKVDHEKSIEGSSSPI